MQHTTSEDTAKTMNCKLHIDSHNTKQCSLCSSVHLYFFHTYCRDFLNAFARRHILCVCLNCSIVWRQKPFTRTMKYIKVSSLNMSSLRNEVADTSLTQPLYSVKSEASLTAVCTRSCKSICLVTRYGAVCGLPKHEF